MAKQPVILLTFANPLQVPEAYLPMLTREEAEVYKHLRIYDIDNKCDIERINNASVDLIFDTVEAWMKRREVVLFHYGGHADGGSLLLQGEAEKTLAANAAGLAQLLGKLEALQLVFLNGCSTLGQVKLLLDKGVKAVIATSRPVQDEMALDFSARFYKNLAEGETIKSAFEQARLFIETKYSFAVQKPLAFRALDYAGKAELEAEIPWGLYLGQDGESALAWTLPQEVQVKSLFGEVDKYACDRSEQNSIFKTRFLTLRGEQKVQFFFIHGEERQSPLGLFKRFVLEHIEPAYERIFYKSVRMDEAAELEGAKLELLTRLFEALELSPNRYKRSELTLRTVADAPIAREVECLAIKFKVYSSSWKEFTGAFMEWFLHEFSREEMPPHAPDFIFFLSVIYDEKAEGGFFNRLLKRTPRDKILKTVQQFSEITVLEELPPVIKGDINKWFDRLTDDPLEKETQLDKYFPGEQDWEMVRVEKKLEQIIEVYNEQNMKE